MIIIWWVVVSFEERGGRVGVTNVDGGQDLGGYGEEIAVEGVEA